MSERCVFCRIGSGKIPSQVLFRDDLALAIRDINPRAPTHLLVVPLEHVTYLSSLPQDREALVGHLLLVAGEMARREGLVDGGYRLVVNQGSDAGQEVPHLHVHVLGGRRLGAMG